MVSGSVTVLIVSGPTAQRGQASRPSYSNFRRSLAAAGRIPAIPQALQMFRRGLLQLGAPGILD